MSWDDYGYDWDDGYDNGPEAVYMQFDRIVTTTEKAILYGLGSLIFWVPKSVHSLMSALDKSGIGEIAVEGWATITQNEDPSYSVPGELHKGKLTAIEQDVVDETLGDTL